MPRETIETVWDLTIRAQNSVARRVACMLRSTKEAMTTTEKLVPSYKTSLETSMLTSSVKVLADLNTFMPATVKYSFKQVSFWKAEPRDLMAFMAVS